MLLYNNQKQAKSSTFENDSQNDSDKTKDTLYHASTDPIFKLVEVRLQQAAQLVVSSPKILTGLCQGTYTSDRVIRLISAIIKLTKNFKMLQVVGLLDKVAAQITQLRRLLRINRLGIVLKDYLALAKKKDRKKRDFFDICFKTVMLCTDINDMLAYFMQLGVLKERRLQTLKKNVANLYFCECVIWLCFHTYDYFTKDVTDEEKKNRRNNILKYFLDTILSHNDFSQRLFTLGLKEMSALGVASSVFGLMLIWK